MSLFVKLEQAELTPPIFRNCVSKMFDTEVDHCEALEVYCAYSGCRQSMFKDLSFNANFNWSH